MNIKVFKTLMMFAVLLSSSNVAAQSDGLGVSDGVTSFQQDRDAWRRASDEASKPKISQSMIDSITKSGMDNISEAEQVFCYEVATKPMEYTGYTLNNMALTGFCGIINTELKDMLTRQFFANEENIDFEKNEKCVIRPKLMLRFVRGVDYTDVLLSSPCYSMSIFYAGKVKTYNFNPGAEIIDTMIASFSANRIDFTSPALLNQLLPVGVAQTEQQQKAVEKKTTTTPVRSWDNQDTSSVPQQEKKSGWNNLAF